MPIYVQFLCRSNGWFTELHIRLYFLNYKSEPSEIVYPAAGEILRQGTQFQTVPTYSLGNISEYVTQ